MHPLLHLKDYRLHLLLLMMKEHTLASERSQMRAS